MYLETQAEKDAKAAIKARHQAENESAIADFKAAEKAKAAAIKAKTEQRDTARSAKMEADAKRNALHFWCSAGGTVAQFETAWPSMYIEQLKAASQTHRAASFAAAKQDF
jgi:hypothetical protein